MTTTHRFAAQLSVVRDALIEDATRTAGVVIAGAEAEGDALVAAARADVEDQVERARRRGAAKAEARSAQRVARARAEAHRQVLAAQADQQRRLEARVHDAVLALRAGPDYDDVLAALEKLARDRLGETAEIVRDVPGVGGVTGQRKGARVDYTLPALAERVLATIDVGDLSS